MINSAPAVRLARIAGGNLSNFLSDSFMVTGFFRRKKDVPT